MDYKAEDLLAIGDDPSHFIEDVLTFRFLASNLRLKEVQFKICTRFSALPDGRFENWYDYLKKGRGAVLIRHPELPVCKMDDEATAVDILIETGNWGAQKQFLSALPATRLR